MLRSPIFTIVLLIAIMFMVFQIFHQRPRKLEVDASLSHAQQELEKLESQKRLIDELGDYFKTRSFQEKEARIKFNLKKPGEEVVIIQKPNPEESKKVEIESDLWSIFQNWLSRIFK